MILDRAEILSYLGLAGTVTTAQDGRLNMLQPMVEDAVKGHLGYRVEQAAHTHYLPASRQTGSEPEVRFYDAVGGKAIAASVAGSYERKQLLVPELPIRSVASIYEDSTAKGGQGATDFAAGTLLTAGTDYWVDYETNGVGKSGLIYRTNRSWSGIPRTIKITYTAGYTQTELSTGIAAAIKGAAQVVCVDNDPQALKATRDNAARNGVDERILVMTPEQYQPIKARVVLANILAGPLIGLAPVLLTSLCTGGWLVLSGLLKQQAEEVTNGYRPQLNTFTTTEDEGWVRLVGQKVLL